MLRVKDTLLADRGKVIKTLLIEAVMLEMKVFRESPEKIFEDLEKRNLPKDIALSVIDLDNKWRKLIEKGNRLRAKRNTISKTIGELKKRK